MRRLALLIPVVLAAATLTANSATGVSLAPSLNHTSSVDRYIANLVGVSNAQQIIVVSNPHGWKATLSAYELTSSGWRAAPGLSNFSANLGAKGFVRASDRIQGTQTTPAGSFSLGLAFGNGAAPSGTKVGYRVVQNGDRWVYDRTDPKTYNTFQTSGDWNNQEVLHAIAYQQYRYAVVIGFNRPVMSLRNGHPHSAAGVNVKAGGGIFLHVKKVVNGVSLPTAGCVSVSKTHMAALLTWLNPARHPRIIMGPDSVIYRSGRAIASVSGTSLVAARNTTRIGTSAGGRPITAIRLGAAHPTRTLVVIGVIHGSEREGARVVARLRSSALPKGLALWLVPSMNPDGFAENGRRNGHGVDLNRNFTQSWRTSSSSSPNYSGPSPASEPETKAVMKFLDTVNPTLVVVFHSPLNGVDISEANTSHRMANARNLAKASGFPTGNFTCNGGCHGTLVGWFNGSYKGQAVTFEFGQRTPTNKQISRVAAALLAVGSKA